MSNKPHGQEDRPQTLDEFLEEMKNIPRPPWKPGAWYNKSGDILEVHWSEKEYYARWLNHTVTLLLDFETNEVIGCQVWGLSHVLDEENLELRTKHHESMEHEGHIRQEDDAT